MKHRPSGTQTGLFIGEGGGGDASCLGLGWFQWVKARMIFSQKTSYPSRIKMAGRRGDSETPYLSLNQEEWEIDGFVWHPDGYGFNLWSCITLDDAWSYISED